MTEKLKVLFAALSDPVSQPALWLQWCQALKAYGIEAECADMLAAPCLPQQKAQEFNRAVKSGEYDWILDVSGGNLSNLCLPYLDLQAYGKSRTVYAGFSDCSAVVDALACSKKGALLYPVWLEQDVSRLASFLKAWSSQTDHPLARPKIDPLNTEAMDLMQNAGGENITDAFLVTGGNIRCFMKLSGTPWYPDGTGCLLFLESSSCSWRVFESFLAQIDQTGLGKNVSGVIFGRFNVIEQQLQGRENALQKMGSSVMQIWNRKLPLFACETIGHIPGSAGIWIGPEPV